MQRKKCRDRIYNYNCIFHHDIKKLEWKLLHKTELIQTWQYSRPDMKNLTNGIGSFGVSLKFGSLSLRQITSVQ